MMEVAVEAGVLADLSGKVNAVHGRLMRPKARPVHKPVGNSVTAAGASGTIVIEGTPGLGRVWNVLGIVLANTDLHTALAGVTVDVYGGLMADPSAPSLDCAIAGNLAVPSVTWMSKEVVWVAAGERVVAQYSGASQGDVINLIVKVAEYNIADVEAGSIP